MIDADELICSRCGAEAFIRAETTPGRPVSLCADCFAAVEPEVLRAARDRKPSDGPPVQLIRNAVKG